MKRTQFIEDLLENLRSHRQLSFSNISVWHIYELFSQIITKAFNLIAKERNSYDQATSSLVLTTEVLIPVIIIVCGQIDNPDKCEKAIDTFYENVLNELFNHWAGDLTFGLYAGTKRDAELAGFTLARNFIEDLYGKF